MQKQTIISILFGVLVLVFAVSMHVYADWTAPLNTSPTCNAGHPGCDPPVNVGGTLQHKQGTLQVDNFRSYFDGIFDGNVGIGTTNPGGRLTIEGPMGVLDPPLLRLKGTTSGIGRPLEIRDDADILRFWVTRKGAVQMDPTGLSGPFLMVGTDEFVVLDTGQTGIGTDTPQNRLDVAGGAVIGSSLAGVQPAPPDGLYVEGRVGMGLAPFVSNERLLISGGGIQFDPQGVSKGTCGSGRKGTLWFTPNLSPTPDTLEICAQDGSGTYAWRTIYP